MGKTRWRGMFGAAATVLLLAGCASSTTTDNDSTTSAPATSTADEEERGPFDFTAETLDGGTLEGESLKGKDVVLWFWAPWCPICLVEGRDQVAPALAELPDDVEFIGIAGRSDDLAKMSEFIDWTGTGAATHIADTDGSIWEGFSVVLQPAFYFVNQDGAASRAGSGLTTDDILAEVDILTSK